MTDNLRYSADLTAPSEHTSLKNVLHMTKVKTVKLPPDGGQFDHR